MAPSAAHQDQAPPEALTAAEGLALVALGVSGTAIMPLALNRFVFAKLAVAAAGVLLATYPPARGRLPRPVSALLVVAAGLLALAALTGPTPLAQMLGRPPRYEGIFVLTVYLGAVVGGARLLGANRAGGASRRFLAGLAWAALAVGAVALLEALGLRPLASDVARPGSLLGNASDEGAWAILAMGPLASVAIRGRRPLHIAGTLAATGTIVCSGSRGALVGAVVAAAILAGLAPAVRPRAVVLVGLAVMVIGVGALPATRARVLGGSPLAAKTAAARSLIWAESIRLVLSRPGLGVGPSGYADAIITLHSSAYYREVVAADTLDSPHDWPLQAASAGGVGLVAVALGLVGFTLRLGRLGLRRQVLPGETAIVGGMLAGLCGYAVALLFHFTSPGTTPLAAVFAGALLANGSVWIPRATIGFVKPAAANWARRVARLALGALIVVFMVSAIAEVPLRRGLLAAASGEVGAADQAFHQAGQLRPWDAGVGATAAHAFAGLAAVGVAGAAAAGDRWDRDELRTYPGSVQALEDGATLARALHAPDRARELLNRALARDPRNPVVRKELATLVLRSSAAALPGPWDRLRSR